MAGSRGPIPKRSEERRRTNEPEGVFTKHDEATAAAVGVDLDPQIPAPDEAWEESVAALYNSLQASPGVVFMYAADWHLAWQLCEQLDQNLKPQFVGMKEVWNYDADVMEKTPQMETIPMKGATVSALLAGFRSLGVTEEARRRMGHEAPALKRAADRAATPAHESDVVASRDELADQRQRRFLG